MTEQMVIDFTAARAARDEAMERATDRAEVESPGWTQTAFAFLSRYAETHDRFPGWFVTASAGLTKAVPDASPKAWGSIFKMAAKRGLIEKDGFMPDPNRHMNPAPVWRSRVFVGDAA